MSTNKQKSLLERYQEILGETTSTTSEKCKEKILNDFSECVDDLASEMTELHFTNEVERDIVESMDLIKGYCSEITEEELVELISSIYEKHKFSPIDIRMKALVKTDK